MFDRAPIARPLGHCRIVGRSKQSRQARGAPGRSSIHTFSAPHQAAEPSSPAFPTPLHAHVPTTNQENVCMVLPLGRETAAVRRALWGSEPHVFSRLRNRKGEKERVKSRGVNSNEEALFKYWEEVQRCTADTRPHARRLEQRLRRAGRFSPIAT